MPFSSIEFSDDGADLFAGECMTREATIKHYTVGRSGNYTAQSPIKSTFRSIDGIAVSMDKTLLAAHGTMRNADKKDLK